MTCLPFSKTLFVAPNGLPMNFQIGRCERATELEEYIKYGGGILKRTLGPFTILLEDSPRDPKNPPDSFKPDFIFQCCTRNIILPLAEFRSNSDSTFSADFDPNHILLHKISWKVAEEKYKITRDDSDSNQDVSPDESVDNSQKGGHKWRTARTEFSQLDRKEMIQFIIKNKAFSQIKGTSVWKRMQLKFQPHTWQSLRQHFLKKVMPDLNSYDITPAEANYLSCCFKSTQNKSTQNRQGKSGNYSRKEDSLIKNYIKKNATPYTPLGGNQFWVDMQRKKVVPGRTWQSVRERYNKILKHEPSNEAESDSPSESNDVDEPEPLSTRAIDASTCPENAEGVTKKPSKQGKRKLFSLTQDLSHYFTVVDSPGNRLSSMEKQFNNPKSKKSNNLKLALALTEEQDTEDEINIAGPITSTQNEPGTASEGAFEGDNDVEHLDRVHLPPSIAQEPREETVESTPNFPPELVVFVSDSESDQAEESASEDSDWSLTGEFYRGGIEVPEQLKSSKRNHVGHVTLVPYTEYNSKFMNTSPDQCESIEGNQSVQRENDHLESNERDHSEVTPSKSLNGVKKRVRFNLAVDMSYNNTMEAINVNSQSQKSYAESELGSPIATHNVGVQVGTNRKRHFAVQTDPVLVLPSNWRSEYSSIEEISSYLSNQTDAV